MVSCEENPCCEEKNVTGFLFSRAKGVQIKNNPINMIHNLGSHCLKPRSGVLIALSRCTCIGEDRTYWPWFATMSNLELRMSYVFKVDFVENFFKNC